MAVHSVGSSGQADTIIISSKPDINTGSTCNEYLSKKCEERGPPLNENISKLFKNLVYNDIRVEKLEPKVTKFAEIYFKIFISVEYNRKNFI